MADLADKDASLTVKIVGASSTGAETNFIDATINGIKVDGSAVAQPIKDDTVFLSSTASTGTTNFDVDVTSHSNLILQITGTWTGDIQWFGSVDGVNFSQVLYGANLILADGQLTTLVNDNSVIQLNVAGFKTVRFTRTILTGLAVLSVGLKTSSSLVTAIQSPVFLGNTSVPITNVLSPLLPNAPATANVTTSSSIIVAANSNRKGLVITNLTGTRIFLSFGSNPAVANRGIMLANGGTFVMDSFTFNIDAVRAITQSGSSTVSIQEFQ